MTQRTAACPNCGASIAFRWSSAVQTTCEYCRSILVRHDVALERVGVVGDLPPDSSPIQRGTEGRWRDRAFVVVGRIVYEHGRGSWSEWHLRLSDGTSAWLSDAQLEWAVSTLVAGQDLPAAAGIRVGQTLLHDGARLEVTTLTRARYRGVDGELPFEYWGKEEILFADLRSESGRFATIDYSEVPPLLFVGEFVTFDDLRLTGMREFDGWPAPR